MKKVEMSLEDWEVDLFTAVRDKMGAEDYSEVIKYAIVLLEAAVNEAAEGRILASFKDGEIGTIIDVPVEGVNRKAPVPETSAEMSKPESLQE